MIQPLLYNTGQGHVISGAHVSTLVPNWPSLMSMFSLNIKLGEHVIIYYFSMYKISIYIVSGCHSSSLYLIESLCSSHLYLHVL